MVPAAAELPEVGLERDAHLGVFRGREPFLRAVDEHLASAASGYLLLLGGPGQGKSALACALARRHDAPLHLVGSHRNPARFVPSLLAQARARSGRPTPSGPDLLDEDDLRSALVVELDALARVRGAALLVIDALDELDDPAVLSFLPIHLPPQVHVILTARPDLPIVSALRVRIARLVKLDVPPLDASDVLALAEREGGDPHAPSLASLLERTGGNALLVTRALASVAAGSPLDLATVASSLEELFEGVHRQMVRRGGVAAARAAEILAVARAPLSPADLGAIAGSSLSEMREAVDAASELLQGDGSGAYRLWHHGFAEHVRRAILGADGERETHGALVTWSLGGEGGPTPYGLAHGPRHLAAAGRAEEARSLSEDVVFLERRLHGGAVAEAVLDLDGLGSPLLLPIKRHAHWLARRPSSLRTVLDLEGLAAEARGLEPSSPWLATRPAPRVRSIGPRFVLQGHGDEVVAIAVDASGRRVASASADGLVRVWDLASTRLLASTRVTTRRALSVAWSSDGLHLASGTDDRGALLLDAADLHEIRRVETGSPTWAVVALPEGGLATGSRDGEVRIWDATGAITWQAPLGGVVASLALSPDGTSLAASGTRGRLVVWSSARGLTARSGVGLTALDLSGAEHETVWSVDFARSPRGGAARWRLVAASSEGRARVVDGDGWEVATIELPDERLFAAALSPAGDRLAVGGTSGRLRVFRLAGDPLAGDPVETPECLDVRAHGAWIDAVTFLPHGEVVLTSSVDRTVRAFSLGDLDGPSEAEPEARPTSASFSHRGESAAIGAIDGTVTIVDAEIGAVRARAKLHSGSVSVVSSSPSGRMFVSGSQDGSVVVSRISPSTGKAAHDEAEGARALAHVATLRGHEAGVTAAAFSAHEGQLATGSRDRTVRLWTLFGARDLARLPIDATASHLAFSPGGELVACATAEGTLFAWSVEEGFPELVAWPVGGPVEELLVSPRTITVRRSDGTWWARTVTPALEAPRAVAPPAPGRELVSGASPRGAALGATATESIVVDAVTSAVVAAYPVSFRQVRAAPVSAVGARHRWIALDDTRFYLVSLVEP